MVSHYSVGLQIYMLCLEVIYQIILDNLIKLVFFPTAFVLFTISNRLVYSSKFIHAFICSFKFIQQHRQCGHDSLKFHPILGNVSMTLLHHDTCMHSHTWHIHNTYIQSSNSTPSINSSLSNRREPSFPCVLFYSCSTHESTSQTTDSFDKYFNYLFNFCIHPVLLILVSSVLPS